MLLEDGERLPKYLKEIERAVAEYRNTPNMIYPYLALGGNELRAANGLFKLWSSDSQKCFLQAVSKVSVSTTKNIAPKARGALFRPIMHCFCFSIRLGCHDMPSVQLSNLSVFFS